MTTLDAKIFSEDRQLQEVQAKIQALMETMEIVGGQRWPKLEALLRVLREVAIHEMLHLESADPFQVGRLRGNIETLDILLNTKGATEMQLSTLRDREVRLKEGLERKRNFKLRPGAREEPK